MLRGRSLRRYRVARILSAMIALVLLATVAEPRPFPSPLGQAPARDASLPGEVTGTGRLSVSVLASDTGAPVRRARVMLTGFLTAIRPSAGSPQGTTPAGPSASVSLPVAGVASTQSATGTGGSGQRQVPTGRITREGQTDERGRVEFRELPAAAYGLAVSPPTGFVRPTRSQSVRLADGEEAALVIRLVRGGAITGHVFDEAGDPMPRVAVRAMGKGVAGWSGRLDMVGTSGTTDDRGEFRIYDLPPGEYYVCASPSIHVERFPPVGSSDRREPRVGHVPTWYPGAPNLDGARRVLVHSGQDSAGVDFGVLQGRLGRVTGIALDAAGNALAPRGSVSLISRSPETMGSGRGAGVGPDGGFAVEDVTPGDYFLAALAPRGEGATAEREAAYLPITVNGDEVVLTIRTNRGATLSGRVVTEGTLSAPPPLPGVTSPNVAPDASRAAVNIRPASFTTASMTFAPGKAEPVGEDGSFRIEGVRGSVFLQVASTSRTLKGIRLGGQDVTLTPFELLGTENIEGIEVVLTNDTGNLVGAVTDSAGKPAADAWVIAFPDDASRWFPGSPFVRPARVFSAPPVGASTPSPTGSARPGGGTGVSQGVIPGTVAGPVVPRAPGQFAIWRLLPGSYYVAAVADEDSGTSMNPYQLDAEFLSRLRPRATRVMIDVGATASVDLRIAK